MNQNKTVTKSRLAQQLTWLGYTLMLLLMIITSLPYYLPEKSSPLVIAAVKAIPLLLVLPGMLRRRLRAYIWLCFIILFYFTQSVVEAFLSKGAGLDLIITVTSMLVFMAAMLHVKWERDLGRTL